jgi:threonine aldolase
MKTVDLRSDTVTRPTPQMRAAMASAEVGDDVYGEDPTVNRLESLAAELTGQEAALFVASGTQGNLLGILAHCERGDEYVAGQLAHCYKFEGGGAAVLGSVQPQPVEMEPDGTLDLDRVAAVVKPVDSHFARTRLLCLENTQGGKVLPPEYLERARSFARERGLGLHLDGARVFNAAVRLGVEVSRITAGFDSVSICLSKGLGAPAGSLLVGRRDLLERARRWRKVVGGGMRQAGILAAAGIHALEHHVARMAEDHDNARRLAEGLAGLPYMAVDPGAVQTNMTFAVVDAATLAELRAYMAERSILLGGNTPLRMVTHLDVTADDVERVVAAAAAFAVNRRAPQPAAS